MNTDMNAGEVTRLHQLCDTLTKELTELVNLAGERYGLLTTTDVFQLGVATGIVAKAKASVVIV